MIKITFQKQNGEYKSVISEGHAEFAESGEDIVCSAVSVLLINFTIPQKDGKGNELEHACSSTAGFAEQTAELFCIREKRPRQFSATVLL